MKVDVTRAIQSPMNATRWCLELACGHEVWVNGKSKPKKTKVDCTACDKKGKS
jgi:hypothetical protein